MWLSLLVKVAFNKSEASVKKGEMHYGRFRFLQSSPKTTKNKIMTGKLGAELALDASVSDDP